MEVNHADGLLTATAYSDTTPQIGLAYDAFQRLSSASNSVSRYVYMNSHSGTATNEIADVGDRTFTLKRTLDDRHRLSALTAEGATVNYRYDAENRLAAVSNDVFAVYYAYTPDGWDAGYTVTLTNGIVLSRNLTRDTYRRQLVTVITNAIDGVPVNPLVYGYDLLNRVTTRNADSFGYNARSEVTSAIITPSHTNRFEFDNIGNNLWMSVNTATNFYSANPLNQYTNIAIGATLEPEYDLDGNLTWDGQFSYTWDGENRLIAVYSNTTCIVSNAYDHQSRRVAKWTPSHSTTFLYDGWNPVMEIQHSNIPTFQSSTNRYVWGKDLSGTLQVTGGIGGLLAVSLNGEWFFPFYDNNGNITAYIDEHGTIVAEYTYDAFGRTIAQSGPMADAFPHRFSTKYFDAETGLYYYGYRFYSPELMRWLNRDPIEEDGGVNLFLSCANNMLVKYDAVGLWDISRQSSLSWVEAKAEEGDTFRSLSDLIKLDFLERTKWLKQDNNTFVAESAVAKKGCIYKIPNVMAVYTSKSGWGDGVIMYVTQLKRRAIADGEKYSSKGYKLIPKQRASSADDFIDLWGIDGLVAISFAGHGTKYGFKADKDSGYAINPSEVFPKYRLQAVRAYSCFSNADLPGNSMMPDGSIPTYLWKRHVSKDGSYVGFTGWANWLSQFWQEVSVNPDHIPD